MFDTQSVFRGGFEEFRRFVNPLIALRAKISGEPVELVSTQDGRLVDRDGRSIEDFHGTQAFGHRAAHVTTCAQEFLSSSAPSWFPARVSPFAGRLAKRLCDRVGQTVGRDGAVYDNVFFANSGSEAVEASIKLARAATGRPRVLSLLNAYHGCTMGSCGLMSPSVYRDLFQPHVPGLAPLPFADVDALDGALRDRDVAAVVVEPIQLEGGVRPLPPAYIDALCERTAATGTLLVADEVQTGLGRTGRFLASEGWPRRPDAVLLGKHLGGGLMPLSAMLTRSELFERAYGGSFETSEAHNCTFSGNALACVASHAALDLLTSDLVARVAQAGAHFRNALRTSLADNGLVANIRGDGLIVGIELAPVDHPWLSFEHFGLDELADKPSIGLILCHRLYKRGFFCFVCGHDWRVLRLQPRFDVPLAVLDDFTCVIRDELAKLSELV